MTKRGEERRRSRQRACQEAVAKCVARGYDGPLDPLRLLEWIGPDKYNRPQELESSRHLRALGEWGTESVLADPREEHLCGVLAQEGHLDARKICEVFPASEWLRTIAGSQAALAGELDEALAHYDAAHRIVGDDPAAWHIRDTIDEDAIRAFVEAGRADLAESALARIIERGTADANQARRLLEWTTRDAKP